MRYQDVELFAMARTGTPGECGWPYLSKFWESFSVTQIEFNPDFQRGHVWSKEQKIDYIEFCLKGGKASRELIFACQNYDREGEGTMYLVDGLQRLTAVQEYLEDGFPAFGTLHSEFTDRMDITTQRFRMTIVDIDREDMLKLYLGLNSGGTPHAKDELDRVQDLLDAEQVSKK